MMWDFFSSVVKFLGKLIPSSGKKRKVKTLKVDGDVFDQSVPPLKPDKPN